MQCVEFENQLNDFLDQRIAPGVDRRLVEHAQSCAGCSELLAAHEALLEGVAALPLARLGEVEVLAIAHRIAAEVGSAPMAPFQAGGYSNHSRANSHLPAGNQGIPVAHPVELAHRRAAVVAKNRPAPVAVIAFALATAAALLIALLPWFRGNQQPLAPAGQKQLIVDSHGERQPAPGDTTGVLQDYNDLIARVGYQVADGLTPVTNSMVSALRELRKRPLFRTPEDAPGRSSSYLPREADNLVV